MQHDIVSRSEWLEARKALLAEEKAFTRAKDALSAKRRALPWVRLDKSYVFEGPDGQVALADLFNGRSQLVVQHFMFAPGWAEGCPGCSFMADHVDGVFRHLIHHDVAFAAVSRAPYPDIEAFKIRMGWDFPWVSSHRSDFNRDFNVQFTSDEVASTGDYNYAQQPVHDQDREGLSVFLKDGADIFHTYSTYDRGTEQVMGAYGFLDITPLGRNETNNLGDWVRHHDRYALAPHKPQACGCGEAAAG
jgi:predicted dithiol-disulfide oxidoreductase (DUF899 family)